MVKIAIGADHGGFSLKVKICDYLKSNGYDVIDFGTYSDVSVDYPGYAMKVGMAIIERKAELGILVCGSGVGVTVAANKIPGIRAAMCHDSFSARQGREDDNVNVLCLGARVVGAELALDLVRIWLESSFSYAERHVRRLSQVEQMEKGKLKGND